jgi:hypothetical protein
VVGIAGRFLDPGGRPRRRGAGMGVAAAAAAAAAAGVGVSALAGEAAGVAGVWALNPAKTFGGRCD